MEVKGIQVVDNFCIVPDEALESACMAGFGTWLPNKGQVGSSIYEGMGFVGDHAVMVASLIEAVEHVIVPNNMFFRNTNVGMEEAYIHSDRQQGNYTCVAYLTDHEEEYGTAFYRHKSTGLDRMPSFKEMNDMGIFEQLKEDMVNRNPDAWEQTHFVKGQYNRAVIFDGPLFHSRYPVEGIGKDVNDGRIIWACHFYKLLGDGSLT